MSAEKTSQMVAILTIGSLRLALPQSDIVSVDVVADTRPVAVEDTEHQQAAAMLHRADGEWPVYAFSEKLMQQDTLTESSRFCVCLKRDDVFFALATDGVEVLQISNDVPQEDLAEVMKTDYTPVLKLMDFKHEIALVVDVLSINHYLEYLELTHV